MSRVEASRVEVAVVVCGPVVYTGRARVAGTGRLLVREANENAHLNSILSEWLAMTETNLHRYRSRSPSLPTSRQVLLAGRHDHEVPLSPPH